jgi:glycosyltransferase involved in cell wall biosynthesis
MTTDAVGGVWVYATDLARGLCADGCEVTLAVMGPAASAEQLESLRGIRGLALEPTGLALEWMDPAGRDVARARDSLLRLAARVRPDVVHINSYREAGFDWPAPVLVVAHSCVMSWWQACHGRAPDDARWDDYAEAVASGLAGAAAWAAPTDAFRDTMQALYRPPTRGRVIWNGTAVTPARVRKQPHVLAAGRLWDKAKGLAALAAVARDVDWPIRIAGPVQEPGAALAPPLDGVTCLGALSRTALLGEMQRASIFASPARYEPFGLSVLEAAAAGCALMLADIPTFRELWSRACLFVDPQNPAALRNGLQRLYHNDELRAHLQAQARERARRYALRTTIDGYRALYEAMLTSGGAQAQPNLASHELRA